MAELIPQEYRVRVAMRRRAERWILGGILALVGCATSLVLVYAWQARTAAEVQRLSEEFQQRSALITRSQELRGKRQDLAGRMQTIQCLMDDKVLLALLRNVAESFSTLDALESIHIDARGHDKGPITHGDAYYAVRITGITSNSSTLGELMTRLSRRKDAGVDVTLEMSRRENYLDGQVMRFQIICERGKRSS